MRTCRWFQFVSILCVTLFMAGCPSGDEEFRELGEADNVTNTDPVQEHHHDVGPNGGHILEFGDYHGEITYKDGIVSVFVLDEEAQKAVPLKVTSAVLNLKVGEGTVEIALTTSPLEGESEGMSSRFVSEAEVVPETVKDIEGIQGNVVLQVGEESLTAEIEHDHHDHEGHDH